MASYFDQWNSTAAVRPSQILDQRFGVVLESGDFVSPLILPLGALYLGKSVVQNYSRPWRSYFDKADKGSRVNANKNKYEIHLDVQQFEPNEITVKVNGNAIVIEGNHQEKQDSHGSVSRQFVRKYVVPNGHNLNKASSSLSSDGVLVVSVPRIDEAVEERVIPVLHTGAPNEQHDNCHKDAEEQQADEKHEEEQGDEKKA